MLDFGSWADFLKTEEAETENCRLSISGKILEQILSVYAHVPLCVCVHFGVKVS